MAELLKQDKVKLLTIIRNLNAKYEYAHLAQYMMTEILPRFQNYEFLEDFRKDTDGPDLKTLLDSTFVYQDKHYNRISKHLRNSHFVDYIVSQMTLQAPEVEESKIQNFSSENPRKRKRSMSSELINEKKSKR